MSHIDRDCDGFISFAEWRDFLLMAPDSTLQVIINFYRDLVFDMDTTFVGDLQGILATASMFKSATITKFKYFIAGIPLN